MCIQSDFINLLKFKVKPTIAAGGGGLSSTILAHKEQAQGSSAQKNYAAADPALGYRNWGQNKLKSRVAQAKRKNGVRPGLSTIWKFPFYNLFK